MELWNLSRILRLHINEKDLNRLGIIFKGISTPQMKNTVSTTICTMGMALEVHRNEKESLLTSEIAEAQSREVSHRQGHEREIVRLNSEVPSCKSDLESIRLIYDSNFQRNTEAIKQIKE